MTLRFTLHDLLYIHTWISCHHCHICPTASVAAMLHCSRHDNSLVMAGCKSSLCYAGGTWAIACFRNALITDYFQLAWLGISHMSSHWGVMLPCCLMTKSGRWNRFSRWCSPRRTPDHTGDRTSSLHVRSSTPVPTWMPECVTDCNWHCHFTQPA
jgi:hypothetical protein